MNKEGYQFRISTKDSNTFNIERVIAHNHRRAKKHKNNIDIKRIGLNYNLNSFNNKKDFISKCNDLYSKELEEYNSIQVRKDRVKDSFLIMLIIIIKNYLKK